MKSLSRCAFPGALACLLTLAAGCGGDGESPERPSAVDQGPAGTPVVSDEVVEVEAEGLPIGEYLPPLDGGRIELAQPAGWKRFPRKAEYVARFYEEFASSLPRVLVTASDAATTEAATRENLPQLLEQVRQEVGQKESLLEAPLPMVIGGRPCVRYVLKVTYHNAPAERQVLVTVLNGRRYEIDLQIKADTIQQYKTAGYAVAASLRPLDAPPAAPGAEPAPAEPAPAEPAVSEPAPPAEPAADSAAPDSAN